MVNSVGGGLMEREGAMQSSLYHNCRLPHYQQI